MRIFFLFLQQIPINHFLNIFISRPIHRNNRKSLSLRNFKKVVQNFIRHGANIITPIFQPNEVVSLEDVLQNICQDGVGIGSNSEGNGFQKLGFSWLIKMRFSNVRFDSINRSCCVLTVWPESVDEICRRSANRRVSSFAFHTFGKVQQDAFLGRDDAGERELRNVVTARIQIIAQIMHQHGEHFGAFRASHCAVLPVIFCLHRQNFARMRFQEGSEHGEVGREALRDEAVREIELVGDVGPSDAEIEGADALLELLDDGVRLGDCQVVDNRVDDGSGDVVLGEDFCDVEDVCGLTRGSG